LRLLRSLQVLPDPPYFFRFQLENWYLQ